MSGVIPQVAALVGPCAAGTAYIPGLADFVPMVKGRGSMALAGPHLVRAAIGEDVTQEELGGSRVHCRKSRRRRPRGRRRRGVHRSASSSTSRSSPRTASERAADASRRPTRSTAATRSCSTCCRSPTASRTTCTRSSAGSSTTASGFDLKPQWAKTIITCLARIGGRPVGIVANQPKQLGGILDNDSADKAARFVNLCNAFGIPLVFLHGRAGLHGRHEGRAGGHHPPRREDALRGRQRDRPEDHRRAAQGLRRRLLRDERPRLRARPDRRLAERPRSASWAPRARSRSSSASRSRRPRTRRPRRPS